GVRRLAVIVICLSIAVIATFLRFWCKIGLKQGIHGNDWLFLRRLRIGTDHIKGLFEGSYGKEIGEIMAELAKRPSIATVRSMENFLMSLSIANTILYLTFYLAKISILLLYRRIFATPEFRKTCLVRIGIPTVYLIAAQVANLCNCIPIDLFWQRIF
ncbi:hypothetical protein QBC36DRAFT_196533, partial [Triangularia setosa]